MSDFDKNVPSQDDAQELNEEQLESVSGGDMLRADSLDQTNCKPVPEPDPIFGVSL